jgi:hypothetical protein
MADEFDLFLKPALEPRDRPPDRQFVARVQAVIVLEQRLAGERSLLLRRLVKELVALASVAAALWWFVRAAPIGGWVAESPALALVSLLAGFIFLMVVLSARWAAPNDFKSLPRLPS